MIQVDNNLGPSSRSCVDSASASVAAAAAAAGSPLYDTQLRGGSGLPTMHLPPAAPPPRPGPGGQPQGPEGVGGHVVVHWTQSGPSVQAGPERDGSEEDEDEDYRPFTPPPPRERLSYTRYQLELLNGIYNEVRYPNSVQKQLIAKRVGITREQVKIWFQNRRRKDVVGGSKTGDKQTTSSDKTDTSQSNPTSSSSPLTTTTSSKTSTSCSPINDTGQGSPSELRHENHSADSGDADSGVNSRGKSVCGKGGGGDGGGGGGDKGDSGQAKMVPDVVVRSVISELGRFSNENLKSRKEKRKKNKHRSHHSSSSSGRSGGGGGGHLGGGGGGGGGGQRVGGSGSGGPPSVTGRLFHTYDMVAPPNKVTPTAFLNTAANRFHHSHNTSAFSSPRDARTDGLLMSAGAPRFPWEGLEGAGFGQQMSGAVANDLNHHHHHANAARGLASMGMGLGSVGQSPGVHDSLPVLSDLLSYRQHLESASAAARDSAQAQSSVLGVGGDGKPKLPDALSPASHHNGVALPTPSLAMNRVFPFPFIADPPIVLSSLHQHDSLRTPAHWPTHPPPPTPPHLGPIVSMGSVADSYKPVMISSLTNPFFPHPPPSSQWPTPPGADSSSSSSFAQL